MKNIPRILMVVAGLSLLGLFLFPMWRITLLAPQYPDGITMHIYINKIGGTSPSTLQNINILNHYIGMKYIEPESIPELKYFPYIIGVMGGLAILFAFVNDRRLFFTWGAIMVVLSILGFYDFYLWEYDYGHDLSPKAPIKIPNASFQPPVFGTKKIINFTAKSYPHIGGYLAGFAILLSFVAWKLKAKFKKNESTEPVSDDRTADVLLQGHS